jgi:hypothetical protein
MIFLIRQNSIVADLASQQLQAQISPMVLVAKSVALNMDNNAAVSEWRTQNRALLDAAEGRREKLKTSYSPFGVNFPFSPS